jgi:hypothetical protein
MDLTKKSVVLDKIPVDLDVAKIITQMKIHGDTRRYETCLREMIAVVSPVARPKALIKICCVENKDEESLEIEGVKFTSRLVRLNLDKIDSVFIGVVTAGTEVESIPAPQDVMQRFCLDAVKNATLFAASTYLRDYLTRHYHTGQLSTLNPGETESFPIDQQKKLFSILGDVENMIGVKLTENCALVPVKSGAGIYYSTETEFISCRLCTNQRCMGRRAVYEPELAKKYASPSLPTP